MKVVLMITCGVMISLNSFSQHFFSPHNDTWKRNRSELIFSTGATQFLGDLGGDNAIGTDFSLKDLDWKSTGFNAGFSYRYRFAPYLATSTVLSVGNVMADDAYTADKYRKSRNLHFKSIVAGIQQRVEVIVFANEKRGNRYSLHKHSARMKHGNQQIYLFSGIGATYYNPKARYEGKWVALRPLSTEGQGLPGGPDKYKSITAIIPFGFGFRTGIGRTWSIGFEATYFKTFTDYMDDVSGTYFDKSILAAQIGEASAALSDRSEVNTQWYRTGNKRGDKEKDAYYSFNVTIIKNITK